MLWLRPLGVCDTLLDRVGGRLGLDLVDDHGGVGVGSSFVFNTTLNDFVELVRLQEHVRLHVGCCLGELVDNFTAATTTAVAASQIDGSSSATAASQEDRASSAASAAGVGDLSGDSFERSCIFGLGHEVHGQEHDHC